MVKAVGILLSSLCVSPAIAGSLDICHQLSDSHEGVTQCLNKLQMTYQQRLDERFSTTRLERRELDLITENRYNAEASLEAAYRQFNDWREVKCHAEKASYASGNGAEQAYLGCIVDETNAFGDWLER